MNATKTIICLANSRKYSGRCIAGKERTPRGFERWIRPVSNRPNGELSEQERVCQNGEEPNILDVIEIPVIKHVPHNYQSENFLIDHQHSWKKVGQLTKCDAHQLIDTSITELWHNGDSSYTGTNDRIPLAIAKTLSNSLCFLQLDQLTLLLSTVQYDGHPRRRLRGQFEFRGNQYRLVITDPCIEQNFLTKKDGAYCLWENNIYICVSIGEPYNGFCYKLIATVIAH
jgi:hypothetical protein